LPAVNVKLDRLASRIWQPGSQKTWDLIILATRKEHHDYEHDFAVGRDFDLRVVLQSEAVYMIALLAYASRSIWLLKDAYRTQ
jgi:hypothetical protein